MPTMDEYAKSGGYARDAQAARNFASTPAPSYSSGSSSSRSSSGNSSQMTPVPYNPTQQPGFDPYFPGSSTHNPWGAGTPPYSSTNTPPVMQQYSGGYMNVPTAGPSSGGVPPQQKSGYLPIPKTGPGSGVDYSYRSDRAKASGMTQYTDKNSLLPWLPTNRPPMPQQGNYKVSADMGMGGTPPPYSATQAGGTPAFPVKTPEAIAAEAKARTDALLAKQTTLAGQTKTGFQTAYDRLASTTKDDRTLADAAFQRNTNPFSGSTGFQKDMTGRQREISDQQSKQDLQTRLANVDLSLADYANATEAQRMQMETDMTNAERSYGLQVDQLALQRRGQEQNQFNADRQFNYGAGRDAVGDARYEDTTNYNRGRDTTLDNRYSDTTSYNRGQDQITNNRNAANDALTLRKQHIDEANYYSDKYNIQVDPKDDFQLVLDQVAGRQTAAQQTVAQKSQDAKRAEAWKIVEYLGTVPEAYADLLGVPAGTQSQKAKEAAMDAAYKNRTLDISQQNANTSSRNADTSRLNADRQANPNQPKQQSLTSYTSALNQRYLDRDNQITDKEGLERAILSLPVDESTLTSLYNYYGIPMR